jgi:hypothetical protein
MVKNRHQAQLRVASQRKQPSSAFCRTHKCAEFVRSLQLQQQNSYGRKKCWQKERVLALQSPEIEKHKQILRAL